MCWSFSYQHWPIGSCHSDVRWDEMILCLLMHSSSWRSGMWLDFSRLAFELQAPPPCASASDFSCRISTHFWKIWVAKAFLQIETQGWSSFRFWTHPFIHHHILCDVPLFVVIRPLVIFCYSKSFLPLRDRNQWFFVPSNVSQNSDKNLHSKLLRASHSIPQQRALKNLFSSYSCVHSLLLLLSPFANCFACVNHRLLRSVLAALLDRQTGSSHTWDCCWAGKKRALQHWHHLCVIPDGSHAQTKRSLPMTLAVGFPL